MNGPQLAFYRILEPLPDAGWLAEDSRTGSTVVLQVVSAADPERQRGVCARAEALAALSHPNLDVPVQVVPVGEGVAVAFSRDRAGRSLAHHLTAGNLSGSERIDVGLQLCQAFDALHRSGLVHGNLSPTVVVLLERPGAAPLVRVRGYSFDDGITHDADLRVLGELLRTMETDGVRSALSDAAAVLPDRLAAACQLLCDALGNTPDMAPTEVADHLPETELLAAAQRSDNPLPGAIEFGENARYFDLGLLGKGGMGEVRRVQDRQLNRTVAMKVVLPGTVGLDTRFLQEAQITSQLQHPAIVPVHDAGKLPDGRLYFTMKEVQGKTFAAIIHDAHKQWRSGEAQPSWTLRQLVGILQRASEGVGYAHHRGVLHRDLKPGNIMVGEFGEVMVMDWGLTRVSAGAPHAAAASAGASGSEEATHYGAIVGTPGYMAPEQARGDTERIGIRSDVYSLGCILYTILSGSPPFRDHRSPLYAAVHEDVPEPPAYAGGVGGPAVPAELAGICMRALRRVPEERYASASEFGAELAAWLDGAQRREQAMRVLEQARELKPQAQALLAEAAGLERQAAMSLMQIPPFAPVEAKLEPWRMQDRAAELRNEAEALSARFTQTVHAALNLSSDLPAAHQMLAAHYKEQHQAAEKVRNEAAAVRYLTLTRIHDDGTFAAYLKGDGALTLETDPPGAQAALYRFENQGRRLVPVFVSDLGVTPIREYPLAMGSYEVRLTAPGRSEVRYPVFIERERHWDGARPGQTSPDPVYLPPAGEFDEESCYVPAGWFWSGGDPQARNSLPARRLWLDAFVTPRDPVTVADYLRYLNALVAAGRTDEAVAAQPAVPEWEDKADPSMREHGFSRTDSGLYVFDGPDAQLRWPMTLVSWQQSAAYAAWLAEAEQKPWTLMEEMQFEKASRGVDARYYPWGNYLDPTFCLMRDTFRAKGGRALRAGVDEFPLDLSPYGVRGCAGNTHAWCEDAYSPTGPIVENDIPRPPDPTQLRGLGAGGAHRIIRGGSWRDSDGNCRTAFRDCPPAIFRFNALGFRVARYLRSRES